MRSQANRAAAGRRRGPDVATISESDAVIMNGWKAQQLCLRESYGGQNKKHGDSACRSEETNQGVALKQGNPPQGRNSIFGIVSKELYDDTTARTIFTRARLLKFQECG